MIGLKKEPHTRALKAYCTNHGTNVFVLTFTTVSSVPGRLRLDSDLGMMNEVARQADGLVPQGFGHLGKALRLDLRQRGARGASAI